MSVTALGAAALLALLQPTPPPPPAQPAPAPAEGELNTVEEVVVRGQRRPVTEFVRQNAAPTVHRRLSRWEGDLCPGLVGLPPKRARYVVDRIAMEALAVGLRVGRPGCRPNVLVIVAADGNEAAAQFRVRFGGRFFAERPLHMDMSSGGGGQTLDDFMSTPRPVRWWHVSRLKGSDGRELIGVPVPNDPEGRVVPMVEGTGASRLRSMLREDLDRVLIIVDVMQLERVTNEALASYLAMVSLAQLNPEAEPGSLPSILTLFRDRDNGLPLPDTLTEWDRAYLRGLYGAPADARNLKAQTGAISRSLRKAAGERGR
jgi:hypothetical protein